MGKKKQCKRLIWGIVIGASYFLVLSILSFLVSQGFYTDLMVAVRTAIVCILGGSIGGILS